MRKQTKLWTTKDGRKIRICDMSDTHLLNTIKFIKRKGEQALQQSIAFANVLASGFSCDSMASMHIENSIDDMYNEEFNPFDLPFYAELYGEKCKRRL